jgi:hypothetical protein
MCVFGFFPSLLSFGFVLLSAGYFMYCFEYRVVGLYGAVEASEANSFENKKENILHLKMAI